MRWTREVIARREAETFLGDAEIAECLGLRTEAAEQVAFLLLLLRGKLADHFVAAFCAPRGSSRGSRKKASGLDPRGSCVIERGLDQQRRGFAPRGEQTNGFVSGKSDSIVVGVTALVRMRKHDFDALSTEQRKDAPGQVLETERGLLVGNAQALTPYLPDAGEIERGLKFGEASLAIALDRQAMRPRITTRARGAIGSVDQVSVPKTSEAGSERERLIIRMREQEQAARH